MLKSGTTRRPPSERAEQSLRWLALVIGSILRDVVGPPTVCLACQTRSAAPVCIEPVSSLAPTELLSVHGTRCDACNDVRLYQVLQNGTTDPDIRFYLDELAYTLTLALSKRRSHGLH